MSPVSRSRTKKSKSKTAPAKGARRSGNPAIRSEQSAEANLAAWQSLLAPDVHQWWADSAEAVLAGCAGLGECRSALAVENAVAAVLGVELAERMAAEEFGFDLPAWLAEVARAAADRVGNRAQDPVAAWLLLYAIAACGTPRAAEAATGHLGRLRPMLDGSVTGAYPWLSAPARPATPTGAPVTAHNSYGDRWMLVAPFAIDDLPDTAHWYCWDIDACATERTVAAAVFATAPDALAEWRAAVGPSAATATPEPAGEITLVRELLADATRTGPMAGFLVGDEPAQLLAEYFRSHSRGTALLESLDPRARHTGRKATRDRMTAAQTEEAADRFAAWCRERERGPLPDRESVVTLADEWLAGNPAPWRYACSPHRVRAMAALINDTYLDEHAREILALFPHWVAWCAEQTGLDPEHTELALTTARHVCTPEALEQIERPEDDAVRITE